MQAIPEVEGRHSLANSPGIDAGSNRVDLARTVCDRHEVAARQPPQLAGVLQDELVTVVE